MNIEHISISRESVWKECQEQYKFKYHLHTIVDVETPFYFVFGSLVHSIIEAHTKAQGKKTITQVKNEVLDDKKTKLTAEYQTKLSLHLNNYMRLVKKIGFEGEVELPFYYDLDPPNKRHLKGFIDRVIIRNNSASIIDYKTTKPSIWRKNLTNITKDLQLACYCWIIMKQFGIPASNIRAALYYLEDAQLFGARFSEATLAAVPERLLQVYKDIEMTTPEKAKGYVGDHCRRCDYRKMCSWYRLT